MKNQKPKSKPATVRKSKRECRIALQGRVMVQASKTQITETGWAILNTGILVFPSIMPLRSDAQKNYASSSIGGWPAMKKPGCIAP